MRLEDPMDLERAWARRRTLSRAALGALALLVLAALAALGLKLLWSGTTLAAPAALVLDDARRAWAIDPQLEWRAQPDPAQVLIAAADVPMLGSLLDAGLRGGKSLDWALVRGADPLAPARSALRHRVRGDWPSWRDGVSLRRAELTPAGGAQANAGPIEIGRPYWIAFALHFDADLFARPGQADDLQSVLELAQSDPSGGAGRPAPFSIETGMGPEPFVRVIVRNGHGAGTGQSVVAERRIWYERAPVTDQWHYFVIRLRLNWDASERPSVAIWRALGEQGALLPLASDDGPNWFEDGTASAWPRFGMLRRVDLAADDSRTVFTKGIQIYRAEPGEPRLDEHSLLARMRAI